MTPVAGQGARLETAAAWLVGLLWVLPLAYALWTSVHPAAYAAHFVPSAPLTLVNFENAWNAAPFARYFLNTFLLVAMILATQLVLCTLAAYAFARFAFRGRELAFMLVLVQLMIMPDVLIVENYRTMSALGILDSILAIGLPYMASAFGIFLLRQTFKQVPRELDEAARVEGAGPLAILWRRLGELSLEQLPVAAHRCQFGNDAAAHRRAAGLRLGRPGRRLVDHHGGDPDDLGTAADRLPAVPAAIRAKFHARRHPLSRRNGAAGTVTPC